MIFDEHFHALRQICDPQGLDCADIGAGVGGLSRELLAQGAKSLWIAECSPQPLAALHQQSWPAQARVVEARGEDLPFNTNSLDLAIYLNSLHHVTHLPKAWTEVWRVLRKGGQLLVAEPLAEGPYFEVTRLIEDEEPVRRAAQLFLDRQTLFDEKPSFPYLHRRLIGDFSQWLEKMLGANESRRPDIESKIPALQLAIAKWGKAQDRVHEFLQPVLIRRFIKI